MDVRNLLLGTIRRWYGADSRFLWAMAAVIALAMLSATPAPAQSDLVWPELDSYIKLRPAVRLFLSAQSTREDIAATQTDVGVHVDFHLKHLKMLDSLRVREPDESKFHVVLLRAGYHFIVPRNTASATEHRVTLEVTPRYGIKGGFVLADRHRSDLRFAAGQFSWRYRNRFSVERPVNLDSLLFTPYARVEFWYDSDYEKWNRVGSFVGWEFPINKRLGFEAYFEHQNVTSKSPNQQVNGVGFITKLYF